MKVKDRVLSIVSLLICGIMYRETYAIRSRFEWQQVGDEVFPRICILLVAVFSLLILLRSFLTHEPQSRRLSAREFWKQYWRVIMLFALTAVYFLLLPHIHFVAATMLYLSSGQLIFIDLKNRKKLLIALAVTLAFSIGVYLVFTRLLSIILP